MKEALAVSIAAAALATAVEANTLSLYAIDNINNDLYRICLNPVRSSRVGSIDPLPDLEDIWELATASDDNLYALNRANDTLLTIAAQGGEVLSSVELDCNVWITRRGFDVHPSGILFGIMPGMQLRAIDPATGTTTYIADVIGPARVEAMAFTADGTLYAVGNSDDTSQSHELYTIDIASGMATWLAELPASDIDSLTAAPDGFLYGADAGENPAYLYRIDPATGDLAILGNTGVDGFHGVAVVSHANLCSGDVNCDGDTDQTDLGILLAVYGTHSGDSNYDPRADFDGDGDVNQADLGELLGDYGCGA